MASCESLMSQVQSQFEHQRLQKKRPTRSSSASTSVAEDTDDVGNDLVLSSQDDTSDGELSTDASQCLHRERPSPTELDIDDEDDDIAPVNAAMTPLERFTPLKSPWERWEQGTPLGRCFPAQQNASATEQYGGDTHGMPFGTMPSQPLHQDQPVNNTFRPRPLISVPPVPFLFSTSAMPVAQMSVPVLMPVDNQHKAMMGMSILSTPPVLSIPFSAQSQAAPDAGRYLNRQTQGQSMFQTQALCGQGRCRPCFEHIRGRCKSESCGYCHGEDHKIRRKQKKHQRRVRALASKGDTDECPQPAGLQVIPSAADGESPSEDAQLVVICSSCEVATAPPLVTNSCCSSGVQQCAPCFLHIRGKCLLGNNCNYCHDPVHGVRHKKKKQQRSNMRAANANPERGSFPSE